jgi:hypothetical protein
MPNKRTNVFFYNVVISTIALSLIPHVSYAYLDMGSGGYLIQIVMAAAASGIIALRVFWGRLKLFLGLLQNKKKNQKKSKDE